MKSPSDKDTLVSFSKERSKRIHEVHEKRLQEVHGAFEKAFPLPNSKKTKKNKKTKKK